MPTCISTFFLFFSLFFILFLFYFVLHLPTPNDIVTNVGKGNQKEHIVGKSKQQTYMCNRVLPPPPPPYSVAECKSHTYMWGDVRPNTRATHTENFEILGLLTIVHYLLGRQLGGPHENF